MFVVTPRTTITAGDIELNSDQQHCLARDLANYLRYEVSWGLPVHAGNILDALDLSCLTTSEGKLSKRLSKWLKETHELELTSRQQSDLGSLIAGHNPSGFTYDIVDRIDWRAGDFGDHGSCFWDGRRRAKEVIIDSGGLALRFFNEEGEGNGRCWLMPYEGDWVAFNAYGPTLELIKSRIAAILPDAKLRTVGVENFGEDTGLLYINDGAGILISRTERHISCLDLEASEDGKEECEMCGDRVDSDDFYWIEGEGIGVCLDCRHENFIYCHGCDHLSRIDDCSRHVIRYRSSIWLKTEDYLCEACLDRYAECQECQCLIARHTGQEEIEGETVCGYCVKVHYIKCRPCGDYYRTGGRCSCQEDEDEIAESVPLIFNLADQVVAIREEKGWCTWETRDQVVERLAAFDLESSEQYIVMTDRGEIYQVPERDKEYYVRQYNWPVIA